MYTKHTFIKNTTNSILFFFIQQVLFNLLKFILLTRSDL